MDFISLKILLFMWQFGLVDTFTLVNFIYNAGAQYGAIVLGAMADGNFTKLPGIFFEPIAGFGLSYQFIKAAETAAERQGRAATLAALLSTSAATAAGSTPPTNAAVGAAIAAHIGHMRDIIKMRRGSTLCLEVKDFKIVLNSVQTPILEIHPYRKQFTEKSKIIIKQHVSGAYSSSLFARFYTKITNNSAYLSSSNCFNSNKYYSIYRLDVFWCWNS